MAPDSSQPPEASVWLTTPVALEASALAARIWAAVTPIKACRTEAEMVVHVVAEEVCELEAAEAEVAPVVEQVVMRVPAARAARAPAARKRNRRRRAPDGSVGCAGGVVMRSPCVGARAGPDWLRVDGEALGRCVRRDAGSEFL